MQDESAVRSYVEAALPGRVAVDVRRFPAGERHAVYRVSFASGDGADVVVRVSLSDSPEERAQATAEATVLRAVGGAAAPVLLDFQCPSPSFGRPAMCLSFVDGRMCELASASEADLARLGATVRRVHSIEADGDLRTYAEDRRRRILADLDRLCHDPLSAELQQRLGRLRRRMDERALGDADGGLVQLHGDVAPENVLWPPTGDGGDPVLIDWEYARAGDPADEIAYVLGQSDLSADAREAFWRGYGGRGQLEERVTWWEPLVSLGSALWWLDRWFAAEAGDPTAPKSPEHYLAPARRRLARAEQLS